MGFSVGNNNIDPIDNYFCQNDYGNLIFMCKEVIIIKCQLIRLAFSLSYNLYCMQRERSFCDRQLTDHSSFCDGILNKEMNLKYRKNGETDFKNKKSI